VIPEIGPIQTFGLLFALNFVGWGAVAARRLRELGRPVDWAYEMVLVALAGGLVGAKLYWAIDNGELALSELFSGSGLTWYGGLLGGTLTMVVWARWRGFLSLDLLDIAAVGLPIGYAIGRVGCQLSGDGDYGQPWDGPWAMAYPDGTVPTTEEVHPTPIYESIVMALVAWALWRLRDRVRRGALFALYLVIAGLERFLVEFLRRNPETVGPFTDAQLWAAALVVLGIVGVALLLRRGGLTPPRTVAPA